MVVAAIICVGGAGEGGGGGAPFLTDALRTRPPGEPTPKASDLSETTARGGGEGGGTVEPTLKESGDDAEEEGGGGGAGGAPEIDARTETRRPSAVVTTTALPLPTNKLD